MLSDVLTGDLHPKFIEGPLPGNKVFSNPWQLFFVCFNIMLHTCWLNGYTTVREHFIDFAANNCSTDTTVSPALEVFWIDNNFGKETDIYWNMFPNYCNRIMVKSVQPHFKSLYWRLPQCFNFSSSTSSNIVPYIEVHALTSYCTSHAAATVTWYHAAKMCKAAGGTLPVFRDREEMEQFIGLLKLSPYKTVLTSSIPKMQKLMHSWDPFHEDSMYINAVDVINQINRMRNRSLPNISTASPEQLQIIYIGLFSHPTAKARRKSNEHEDLQL